MTPSLRIDIVTLFPELLRGAFEHSIVARAQRAELVRLEVHDLRLHAEGPHAQADDAPFGGGGGMVLKPEPVFRCVEALTGHAAGVRVPGEEIVLLTPAGPRHDQTRARGFAALDHLVLICGRYEGVDDRVRTGLATSTLSIGDFVLSGGEPAAAVVVDSVVRLLPGALGNPEGTATESHEGGLLEAPHFTRPASWRGMDVPAELLSGHHEEIRRWRRKQSLLTTRRERPDLVERARREGLLSAADEAVLTAGSADAVGAREAVGAAAGRSEEPRDRGIKDGGSTSP